MNNTESKAEFRWIKLSGKSYELATMTPCSCGEKHGTPDFCFYTITPEEARLFQGLKKGDPIQITRKAGKIIKVQKLAAGTVVF